MNEFECSVVKKLATLEERTQCLPGLVSDVADIKGRVRVLEFKASIFGVIGGAVVLGIKQLFGRSN